MDVVTLAIAKKYTDKKTEGMVEGGAPYIQDGYWYVWDTSTGRFVNSGVKAQGDKGEGNLNAVYDSVSKVLTFTDVLKRAEGN